MRKIYKYFLESKPLNDDLSTNYQKIRIPKTALLWNIGVQNGTICLWAQVDTEYMDGERTFCVVATGQEIPDDCKTSDYRGTVQIGWLVWHVYEVIQRLSIRQNTVNIRL